MIDSGRFSALPFVPSTHGAIAWGFWLALYLINLIRTNPVEPVALAIFLLVEAAMILSATLFANKYRAILDARDVGIIRSGVVQEGTNRFLLLSLHAIGFLGFGFYVNEISSVYGGLGMYFITLFSEAHIIRGAEEAVISVGTQLSYFGWIAIALTIIGIHGNKLGRWWYSLAFLQFITNLIYLDRTRPIWIIYTSSLISLLAIGFVDIKGFFRKILVGVLIFVMIFWGVAEWTGKTFYEEGYDRSPLPGITNTIYIYGVSGFAYFNEIIRRGENPRESPAAFLYPFSKFMTRIGIAEEPPSQILKFYEVPFSTNVGTFLELFYRDGGMIFLIFGVLLCTIGFDLLGLYYLRSGFPLAHVAWANLCFASFIAFFTPKVSSFPFWMFLGLGFISIFSGNLVNRHPKTSESVQKGLDEVDK